MALRFRAVYKTPSTFITVGCVIDPGHASLEWGCGGVDYTPVVRSDSVTPLHFSTSSCLSTGPTPASPTSSSSGDSTHSSHLSEGDNRLYNVHAPYNQEGPNNDLYGPVAVLSSLFCSEETVSAAGC